MNDLIAWLHAQLDDDERAARRLPDAYRRYVCDDGHVEAPHGQWADGSDHLPNHHNTWLLMYDQNERLAEIDAKRKILDDLADYLDYPDVVDGLSVRILQQLALPYADRDGWQDEWNEPQNDADQAKAEGHDPERDEWAQTYRDVGYEWCRPCKEWHRPPECWIDQNGQPQLDVDSEPS